MGVEEIEICSNCKREINRSEQACVFDGKLVCAECDKKLRSGSGLQTVRKFELAKNAKQENKSLDKHQKLKLNCPRCGRSLRGATREMIGDTGICPKCKTEFEIVDSKARVSQEDTEPRAATKYDPSLAWMAVGNYVAGIGMIIVAVWLWFKMGGDLTATMVACVVGGMGTPFFRKGKFFWQKAESGETKKRNNNSS